ncbi:MAG: NifU family protein [bacterium]|nr:NifU family protein [bacterium]
MTNETTFNYRGKDGQRIRVTAEPSLTHGNSCRFVVDPPVYEEGAVHFPNMEKAVDSPLAAGLFEIEGITTVTVAGNSVTTTTDEDADWEKLSEDIAMRIRDQISSGVPGISEEITRNLPDAETVREKVQEIIDTSVNPSVAAHGGVVNLLDVKDNTVYLEFGGGCQGCGMVSVTLKYGVERLIRERVPEVGQILDTTDHASGQNPYYAPASK